MFRFSCFNPYIYSHNQKKTVQLSTEEMQKTLENSKNQAAPKNFNVLPASNLSHLKIEGDIVKHCADSVAVSTIGCDSKSEEMESKYTVNSELSVHKNVQIKKSRSLGSGLDVKGRESGDNVLEDDIDQQFSCDGSHGKSRSLAANGAKESGDSLTDQFQEPFSSDAFQVNSDVANHGSMCSIGDIKQSEKEGHEKSDVQLSGGGESADCTPRTLPVIIKSSSLPIIGSPVRIAYSLPHSRSAEDLNVLDSRRRETLTYEVKTQVVPLEERNGEGYSNDKSNCEDPVDGNCETYNYVASAKDWIIPAGDEVNRDSNFPRVSSVGQWDELPINDFRIRRIEEWVIDLQHCSLLEDSNELSAPKGDNVPKCSNVLDVSPATRMEGKVSPGMQAVKKYMSSLSVSATAAQLVNHGLVVVPFFSAFSSLRALNLSGNAIVRITAGALPRGLHFLNLSKNNISTIEGLRELTRLRVLDLSYNKILRIGHGLASCSSLKELYLAGNKISEVDGLHRLLKLSVLDLRFNKISTTKCLGQLAANYISLQAISLEGNPAQKNVGDEQLKKYLQGLLPHLTYFNRQSMKVGISKDTADRSARLGISAHQIDRGLKADLKAMRKGTHSSASQKLGSFPVHGHKIHASTSSKPPAKTKHVRLPPSGTRLATEQNHFRDVSSKRQSFRSELLMRRSRSEGTFDGL